MAYLVPSDLTQLALSGGAHGPELDTLERLKRELGPQFHVYHGVHWARSYRHYSHFGELDFVIVNNAGAVLVIEQKNGLLEEGEAGLAKRYADGSKSIVRQMHRSIDAIREKYKYSHAGSDRLELDYLLYCPDHRVANVNAAGIDAGRIVDAMRAPQLSQVIAETLGTGGEEPDERAVPVRDFFAQTFDVMPDVGTCIASQEARYTRLTGGLPEVVDNIEMTPFRLRVQATAGSGKTQLALQQFNRAVAAGRRPLYVCFNRPLADRFREVARPEGSADTFYGLIHHFLESIGEKV
ncbi:MAG TPA: nuclease-related domain-containing protein, partial [Gammaproteobacteria bacterium]|nr:nuclease-related domain-containing protein [Gammaproteobacteria bacterium]